MDKPWQRALLDAYRPLQRRGMLMEGQQTYPSRAAKPTPRRWILLAFLLPWRRR